MAAPSRWWESSLGVALGLLGCGESAESAQRDTPTEGSRREVRFEKITLHREFQCEGAALGDFDADGIVDVAVGPDWYRGPNFEERHAIFARAEPPVDVRAYSDCFFQFPFDFDADGWLDVLVVGFPGRAAAWFENPGRLGVLWPRHEVLAAVDGESPAFEDLDGDGRPELVFMSGGALGFAGPDPSDPRTPWVFRPISEPRGYTPFTHGLGVGDLNGDGKLDVMDATGYFIQPSSLAGDPLWPRTEQAFAAGAQLLVDDFDGDGDADVASTLAAHGWGLAWYEQGPQGAEPRFSEHVIVPNHAPATDAPVILHEPHALALADLDGDGLRDLVTGERHWAHVPEAAPFDTPARLYWFARSERDGIPSFEPHLIDDDSGVGTQVTVADLNRDGKPDVVVSNKKGAFVFRQR